MYAIRISTPKVTIKNLKITNQAPGLYTTGIRISASETTIENCDLYNTPIGILTWTSENIINKCKFWGCQDEGIALIGSKYSECNSNIITNCIFYKNCDGLELQYSSKNRITGCEFYDNTHTGIDAIASSNNENTISNCKIYNNMVHGIYLSSSSKNQITNCYISDNTDGNILMDGDSIDNQISLNPVLENNIDNTETEEEHATSKESLLTRIYGLISRLKINQLIPLFTSNNF